MTTMQPFPALPPSARPAAGPRRAAAAVVLAACLAAALTAAPAAAQVGLAQLSIAQPDGPLPVTLSYPTAEANRAVAYGPVTLQVAPDAPPLPGPHRLVLLSHGTGGSWVSDHALAATLVRAGFVVAQPLHQGDNFRDTRRAGPAWPRSARRCRWQRSSAPTAWPASACRWAW
ncbi:MAG TPA: hypothetical protein PK306_23565 [Aquabacterium sp.]|nr:hypothetical protein [Aquabacterium sp.]HQC98684.1 hypothetical protein [Aquabacterium sp.]